MLLLLMCLIFIFSEAFYEASDDKGLSGFVEFLNRSLGGLFFILWMTGVVNPLVSYDLTYTIKALIGYVLLRECIFDYIYNWVADLEWWYIGTTKWRDRFYRRVLAKVPNHYILFARVCIGLMSIGMLLNL